LFHPGWLSPDLWDTSTASRGLRQHQLARKTQLLHSVVGYELWQRLCRAGDIKTHAIIIIIAKATTKISADEAIGLSISHNINFPLG
jgi:hypothetical protein